MATITVAGANISNVNNGKYFVRVQLLDSNGTPITDATSGQIEVTSNPAPVVGPPVVTVS